MKDSKIAKVYDIGTGRPVSPGTARDIAELKSGGGNDGDYVKSRNSLSVFLRHFLVIVLMWLRGPLRFLTALVGVPTMIALPIVILGFDAAPEKTKIIVILVAVSFGTFCIRWLYDSLVMWISPEPLFLNS